MDLYYRKWIMGYGKTINWWAADKEHPFIDQLLFGRLMGLELRHATMLEF